MNNEYLWDKTGEDQEIERLEKTLAVFRYRGTVNPVAVATQQVDERAPRWRIYLAFSFASCVAIGIVTMVGLRFLNEGSNPVNTGDVVFVQQAADTPDAEPVAAPELPPVSNPERQYQPPGNRRRNISRTTAAISRRPKKDTAPPAELTAEEQFAYRQLMLALSITGSKLKIVQDTIDGTEDTNDDTKNQR